MVELNRVRDPKEIARETQLEEEDKAEQERVKAKLRAKGDENDCNEDTEVVDTTLEQRVHDTREVLEMLASTDGQEERGSLLALLELERRIRDESDMTPGELCFQAVLGNMVVMRVMLEQGLYVRLLARYLQTFGSKPSCYEDLRPYVTSLEGSDLAQWRTILDNVPVDAVSRIFRFAILEPYTLDRAQNPTCDV